MKERISEYLRDVKKQAEEPIMRHFKGHRVEDVKCAALLSFCGEEKAYRQLTEERWIVRLGTKTPFGCNIQLHY